MSVIQNYLELSREIVSILNNIHIRNTNIINNDITRQLNYENNSSFENYINLLSNLIRNRQNIQQNLNINENENQNNNENENINQNENENINQRENENINQNEIIQNNENNTTVLDNMRNRILFNRNYSNLESENNSYITPRILRNNATFRENHSFRLRRDLNSRSNISSPISLTQPILPPTPPPPPPPPRTRQTHVNLEPPPGIFSRRSSALSTDEIINLIRQRHSANFQNDIIIRPTRLQIREATRLYIYKDISNNQQSQCPISLTPFEDDDAVLEIIYCKHIFKEINLRRHFRTSVKCPLCRFDIRDHSIATRTLQNTETKNE